LFNWRQGGGGGGTRTVEGKTESMGSGSQRVYEEGELDKVGKKGSYFWLGGGMVFLPKVVSCANIHNWVGGK